jgi:hypothetical protein
MTLFLGIGISYALLSEVGNSSRLPTHVPSSKTRLRHNDPPLTVRETLKEQTRPTDTYAWPEARSGYRTRLKARRSTVGG